MLSNNQVKHINALKIKKYRDEYGEFIAEGNTLVTDLMRSRFEIAGVYALSEWITGNLEGIKNGNVPVFEADPKDMERITALSSPGPVLAVVKIPVDLASDLEEADQDSLVQVVPEIYDELLLMLESISDPGNFGTMLRIADWFGIRNVFCSLNCVELYNPKVVQASMGSVARVRVFYTELSNLLEKLRNRVTVYGTFLNGSSIYNTRLEKNGVILIGSEAHGISDQLAGYVANRILIPSFGAVDSGKAESLNAAVAAAIVISEFRRRIS